MTRKRVLDPRSVRDDTPESRAAPRSEARPPLRVARLKSLDDVRLELGKVYREARTGKLDMTAAKGLAYILTIVSATLKETVLEERVRALEEATSGGAS